MRTWGALALVVGLGVPGAAAVFIGATRPELGLATPLLAGGGVALVVAILGAGVIMIRGGGGGGASGRRAFGPERQAHPGPKPAWISAAAWRQRGQGSRYAMGMPDPAAVGVDAEHRKVSSGMFEAAPRMRAGGSVPSGRFDRQLKQTPPVVVQWSKCTWPVCCDLLTVLQSIQPTPDECAELERGFKSGAWTDLQTRSGQHDAALHRRRDHDEVIHAFNIFSCSGCGRVYANATRK